MELIAARMRRRNHPRLSYGGEMSVTQGDELRAIRATESAYETYLALTQLAELGELARASAADVADASRPPSNSLPLTLRV